MALARFLTFGLLGYGAYRFFRRPPAARKGADDGLAALYSTREEADLAVEHLVQEHGVDRTAIFVEPAEAGNSSGMKVSGGDAPSGDNGSRARSDAPLNGPIRLTVAASQGELASLRAALEKAGATNVLPV